MNASRLAKRSTAQLRVMKPSRRPYQAGMPASPFMKPSAITSRARGASSRAHSATNASLAAPGAWQEASIENAAWYEAAGRSSAV